MNNKIYKYDGYSYYEGNHAVVIVGYGYQYSKFYWLIQNSWGEDFCDNGFAKIEFGEINIENVAFSEPYIESEEDSEIKEISVKLSIRDDCRFEYIGVNEDDYNESFELYFQGPNSTIYYLCNKFSFLNDTKGICNFDLESYNLNEKGIYSYDYYRPLLKNNFFDIEFATDSDKHFYFYQYDILLNIYIGINNYYISEEGSIFMLAYIPFSEGSKFISNIYVNNDANKKLKNCEGLMNLSYYDYIVCNISQDEIEYFDNENDNISLTYDILCGKKEEIPVFVSKLDKTKYPIFRVKHFIKPNTRSINYFTDLSLIANIEGNISNFTAELSYFLSFIKIIRSKKTTELEIYCEIPEISEIQNDYEILCFPMVDSFYLSYIYDEIFILPYYIPLENPQPFEVIIKSSLKGISYFEYQDILSGKNDYSPPTEKNTKNTDKPEIEKEVKTEVVSPNPSGDSEDNCKFIKIVSLSFILAIILIS